MLIFWGSSLYFLNTGMFFSCVFDKKEKNNDWNKQGYSSTFQHIIPVFTKYSFSHGSFKFEAWCSKLWVFFNWTYGKLDFQIIMNIIMLLLQFKMNVCVRKIDNRLSNFCIWVSDGMLDAASIWSVIIHGLPTIWL